MHGSLNIWQILWESGVVVKVVLLILVLASVLSWTIILKKYKELKLINEANEKFNSFFKASNSLSEINREANENQDSTMSLMFRRGYEELNKVGEKLSVGKKGTIAEHFTDHGFQSLERALKTGHNSANEKMDIRVSTLASIGSITPFIGLFGTVWGIYHALTAIGISGQASIDKVAGPVGEALIMTAIGLAVAVPAVLGYNWLTRRNKAVMDNVRSFGSDLHAVLLSGELRSNPVNRDSK